MRYNHSDRYIKAINSGPWRMATKIVRKRQNNLCAECAKHGVYVSIDSIHHILPAERFRSDADFFTHFCDLGNLVGLCRSCHEQADAEQSKGTRAERQRRAKAVADEFFNSLQSEEGHG